MRRVSCNRLLYRLCGFPYISSSSFNALTYTSGLLIQLPRLSLIFLARQMRRAAIFPVVVSVALLWTASRNIDCQFSISLGHRWTARCRFSVSGKIDELRLSTVGRRGSVKDHRLLSMTRSRAPDVIGGVGPVEVARWCITWGCGAVLESTTTARLDSMRRMDSWSWLTDSSRMSRLSFSAGNWRKSKLEPPEEVDTLSLGLIMDCGSCGHPSGRTAFKRLTASAELVVD